MCVCVCVCVCACAVRCASGCHDGVWRFGVLTPCIYIVAQSECGWSSSRSGRLTFKEHTHRYLREAVCATGPGETIWRTEIYLASEGHRTAVFQLVAWSLFLTYFLAYLLTCLLTYLLTPWSRVFLEKLTVSQPVKNFPTFYGTRRFVTAFTSAHHLSLS